MFISLAIRACRRQQDPQDPLKWLESVPGRPCDRNRRPQATPSLAPLNAHATTGSSFILERSSRQFPGDLSEHQDLISTTTSEQLAPNNGPHEFVMSGSRVCAMSPRWRLQPSKVARYKMQDPRLKILCDAQRRTRQQPHRHLKRSWMRPTHSCFGELLVARVTSLLDSSSGMHFGSALKFKIGHSSRRGLSGPGYAGECMPSLSHWQPSPGRPQEKDFPPHC